MRRASLSHISVCDNHLEDLCTLAGAVWGKWAHGMPLLLLLWDGAVHGSSGAVGAAAREVLQVRWLMHDRWGLTTGGGAGSVPGLDPGLSFTEKEPPCLRPEQSHGLATPVRPRPGPAPLPATGTWPSVLCPGCSGLGKRLEACVHEGEKREQGLRAHPPQVPSCRSGGAQQWSCAEARSLPTLRCSADGRCVRCPASASTWAALRSWSQPCL